MSLNLFRRLDRYDRRIRQLERTEPPEGGGGGGGDHPDSDHTTFAALEHDTAHDDRFSLLAHTHAAHPDSDHDDRFALLAAGVPVGGTAGQVLTKDTGTDLDTSWATPAGGSGVGAWQTVTAGMFGSGWGNHASDQPLRYRLEGDIVRLDGSATRSSGTNTTIFTLPSGYRPSNIRRFWPAGGATASVRVAVQSSGTVDQTAGADFSRTSLEGCMFPIT